MPSTRQLRPFAARQRRTAHEITQLSKLMSPGVLQARSTAQLNITSLLPPLPDT